MISWRCAIETLHALLTLCVGMRRPEVDYHDDTIKWKHFPCYWPFVRGIHWSPVNSPHKGQWHGTLIFFWICVWTHGWVNNRDPGYLRRHRAHFDVIVMPKDPVIRSFDVFIDIHPNRLLNKQQSCRWFEKLMWHYNDSITAICPYNRIPVNL